jgi:hypothetical protein
MSVHRFLSKREKQLGRHHHHEKDKDKDKEKDKNKVIAAVHSHFTLRLVASAEITSLPQTCVSVTAILRRRCHRPTIGHPHPHTVLFCSHVHNFLTWVLHSLLQATSDPRSIQTPPPTSLDFSMGGTISSMKRRSRRYSDTQDSLAHALIPP